MSVTVARAGCVWNAFPPGLVYVWVAWRDEDVSPSPKSQTTAHVPAHPFGRASKVTKRGAVPVRGSTTQSRSRRRGSTECVSVQDWLAPDWSRTVAVNVKV